jgi:superfamily II DNA or RNA helicase
LIGKNLYPVSEINLYKINECYIRVDCPKGIAQELSDAFTFFVPNYKFHPKFKNRMWDGKIRLLNLRNMQIYRGLIPHIKNFAEERGYKLCIHSDLNVAENFSVNEAIEFIETLNLPYQVKDYQLSSFVKSIRNKRQLIVSPTGSGKSLILYLIVRFLQQTHKKGLLLVPTTSLVSQMYKDFESYGYDSESNCHMIYSGKEKSQDKFLYISTWQSVYNQPPEYFEQFDFVFVDECHLAKAASITSIMVNCINCNYRIGTTGTLDGTLTNKLVLEGLFGEVFKSTSTSDLIEKGDLSEFTIKCLILKHSDVVCSEIKKLGKKWDYRKEIDYLAQSKKRNTFIKNLALSLEGNTLVLFNLVEKQGKALFSEIESNTKNKRVFYVAGTVNVDERESIRETVENNDDCIIVASYGTYAAGINIKNLHNIIFASPSKSRIRNLQSIGRGLRSNGQKKIATLYDISDDLRFQNSKHNVTLLHFIERVKIYDSEKFDYKFYNIDLDNND